MMNDEWPDFVDSTDLKTQNIDFRASVSRQLYEISTQGSKLAYNGITRNKLINFKNSIMMMDAMLAPFHDTRYDKEKTKKSNKLRILNIESDYDDRTSYFDTLVEWFREIIILLQKQGMLIEESATSTINPKGNYDDIGVENEEAPSD